MSDCTTSNAFLEWMEPFVDESRQESPSSEKQLDLFEGLDEQPNTQDLKNHNG